MKNFLPYSGPCGRRCDALEGHAICWNLQGPDMSDNSTKVYNTDKRLTTGTGDILNLGDASVSLGQGAIFTIENSNAEVAKSGLDLARSLASGANSIASQVADSQRAFVETASGQKTWLWGAAIIALIFLVPNLLKIFKK
jgi:hypothetical protein